MDELVAHITASTGVDAAVARKAAVIILAFLSREGPPDKVKPLVEALGGSAVPGAGSGSGGGVMKVFGDLTAAGLGMGDIQGVASAFVGFAKTKVGAAAVDEVVRSIPGLSQFV